MSVVPSYAPTCPSALPSPSRRFFGCSIYWYFLQVITTENLFDVLGNVMYITWYFLLGNTGNHNEELVQCFHGIFCLATTGNHNGELVNVSMDSTCCVLQVLDGRSVQILKALRRRSKSYRRNRSFHIGSSLHNYSA